MKYTTVFVGMDVHKESFTLACYTNEKEEAEYVQRTEAHYSKVISYLEAMRFHYGNDVTFICGYEAGCLGFTLYHQLTNHPDFATKKRKNLRKRKHDKVPDGRKGSGT